MASLWLDVDTYKISRPETDTRAIDAVSINDIRAYAGRVRAQPSLLAVLLPQSIERVVAEDLALGPLLDGRALARADEQNERAARDAPQQTLDEGGPEEARAAGDRDALAVKALGDHRTCLPSGR